MFVLKFFYTLTVLLALSAHWTLSWFQAAADRIDRFFLDVAYSNGDTDFRHALLVALLAHEHHNFQIAKANGLGYEAKLKTFYPAPEGGDSNVIPFPEGNATANASEPQQNMYACIECATEINLNTYNGYVVCDNCLGPAGQRFLRNFNEVTQDLYQVVDATEEYEDDVTEETYLPIDQVLSDNVDEELEASLIDVPRN